MSSAQYLEAGPVDGWRDEPRGTEILEQGAVPVAGRGPRRQPAERGPANPMAASVSGHHRHQAPGTIPG
jgi:hypothetical protein